jgi:4-hydroxy-3-polyprenylbenzoate decarboxylase
MNDVVLGITGASGAAYAKRLLEVLLGANVRIHLTISPAGAQVLWTELGVRCELDNFELRSLGLAENTERLIYHHYQDFSASIASGSFVTAGMVICPCSMGTLAGVANGLSTNLILRAADVHLKERRKLIVVPRETPLGSIQLENMKRLADAGAVVLPAMPGFYHQPKSIDDLVDFVVARICDQLGVPVELMRRWGT